MVAHISPALQQCFLLTARTATGAMEIGTSPWFLQVVSIPVVRKHACRTDQFTLSLSQLTLVTQTLFNNKEIGTVDLRFSPVLRPMVYGVLSAADLAAKLRHR